jgi:hypothetical protein
MGDPRDAFRGDLEDGIGPFTETFTLAPDVNVVLTNRRFPP